MTEFRRNQNPAPVLPPAVIQKTLKYREKDEHLVRRLGAALVLQWDQLTDEMQDLIIDQAAAVDDRDPAAHEASDIEGFVRNVKTVSVAKAPAKAET
jgi:hypothetical protein